MSDVEDLRAALTSGISTAFNTTQGDVMVTRWVAVVEVMEADGKRYLWALTPQDTKAWESLGLLTYAVQREQAAAVAHYGGA